jgi:ABC-type multidrug transport system ATPase subunit
MGELLKDLQQANSMMVLMISHDPQEIVRLADRVVEIRDGRNIFAGNAIAWQDFTKISAEQDSSLKID